MAETLSAISVLGRLGSAFNRCNFPSFCLKPLQVKCFECLLKRQDIITLGTRLIIILFVILDLLI